MAEVSLYNHAGVSGTYSTGRGIRLYTEDGSVQDFFPGVTEELAVELDFSEGDMVIEPSEGAMLEKVIIPKPAGLISANIAKDVEIAGIEGAFEGGGVELESFLKYFQCRIDPDERTITLYSIHYDLLYEDTGSYDVTIPNTMCGCQVIIATS